ncbi:hypothetical protein Tco_0995216 [Tanacetum coccineum]
MVEPESVKIDAHIRGLFDNIKGEVTSSKPTNLNEGVRMAHKLTEQKLQARNERILEGNKRKWENFQSGNSSGKSNHKDNSSQYSQNNQKQGNARAMTTASNEGKVSSGSLPVCERCFTRHVGQCTIKCHKCGKIRHKARRSSKRKLEKLVAELMRLRMWSRKVQMCLRARKYIEQGCHLFLAYATKKKPKEKRLEDVPVIRDFPEVFPDKLSGLPPPRQVEFQIELVPGAAPVA